MAKCSFPPLFFLRSFRTLLLRHIARFWKKLIASSQQWGAFSRPAAFVAQLRHSLLFLPILLLVRIPFLDPLPLQMLFLTHNIPSYATQQSLSHALLISETSADMCSVAFSEYKNKTFGEVTSFRFTQFVISYSPLNKSLKCFKSFIFISRYFTNKKYCF